MRSIAFYSYRELVRERFVHILFFGALLLFGLCFPLGSLSFEERGRVLYHFGFTAISFTTVGLALFLGSSRMAREFERQTSLIVLARPISRQDFFMGKWLGIISLLSVVVGGLTLILYGLFVGVLDEKIGFWPVLQCGLGIGLEAVLLMTLTMASSMFLRSSICFFFGLGIYLFGNFLPDLEYFASKSKDDGFILFSKVMNFVVPQLYRFNWRSLTLAQKNLPEFQDFAVVLVHGLVWTGFLLWAGIQLFRRKDLV